MCLHVSALKWISILRIEYRVQSSSLCSEKRELDRKIVKVKKRQHEMSNQLSHVCVSRTARNINCRLKVKKINQNRNNRSRCVAARKYWVHKRAFLPVCPLVISALHNGATLSLHIKSCEFHMHILFLRSAPTCRTLNALECVLMCPRLIRRRQEMNVKSTANEEKSRRVEFKSSQ